MIDGKGIEPDIQVENGPPGSPGNDRQILKTIEVLRDYF